MCTCATDWGNTGSGAVRRAKRFNAGGVPKNEMGTSARHATKLDGSGEVWPANSNNTQAASVSAAMTRTMRRRSCLDMRGWLKTTLNDIRLSE
jgi:hypothetical protein